MAFFKYDVEKTKKLYSKNFKQLGIFAISPYYKVYQSIDNYYKKKPIPSNVTNSFTNVNKISRESALKLAFIGLTLVPILLAATIITASLALIAAVILAISAAFELSVKAGSEALQNTMTKGSSIQSQCK